MNTELSGISFDVKNGQIYYERNRLQIYEMNGYEYVAFRSSEHGRNYLIPVHRIVAKAYCKIPVGMDYRKLQVDHIDGCKTNNDPSNLRWVTRKQNNSTTRSRRLRREHCHYESHAGQKLVLKNSALVFDSYDQAAEWFKVSRQAIIGNVKAVKDGRKTKRQFEWIDEKDLGRTITIEGR